MFTQSSQSDFPFVKDHITRWLAMDVALGMNCLISTLSSVFKIVEKNTGIDFLMEEP